MNNLISINDTKIKQDGQGRYCLNDLHKASGGNPIHAPGQFFRNKSIIDFVKALTDMQICTSPVNTVRGGLEQGTYVCEELVYKYASWINPEFDVKVHAIFKKVAKGELIPAQQKIPQSFSEALRLAAEQAEQIEQQNRLIAYQAPKVAFVEHYVETGTTKSLREVAKILKMPEKAMINRLIEDKFLYRQSGNLLPYQSAHAKDLFAVKTGTAEHGHNFTQTRVTPKGIEFIASRYASELMQ